MKAIRSLTHGSSKIFLIILIKNPGQIRHSIQQRKIKALKTVIAPKRLIVMYPHKLDLDIVILTIDIRVGMMSDIMLQLPKVDISAQEIERIRKDRIDPFIV